MKQALLVACLALGSVVVGCGGAGLDATKPLSALEDAEAADLCADAKGETTDCGGGVTFTSPTAAQCRQRIKALPDTCAATVADYYACHTGDLCLNFIGAACAKTSACGPPP